MRHYLTVKFEKLKGDPDPSDLKLVPNPSQRPELDWQWWSFQQSETWIPS